jgi:hypothetical protein
MIPLLDGGPRCRAASHYHRRVRRQGVVKPWPADAAVPRYHHTYLEIDGWDYWTMGAPVEETTVINRARLEPLG